MSKQKIEQPTSELPEELKEIVEKTGMHPNQVASIIYHWKADEIRYQEQQIKDQETSIRLLDRKVKFRTLFIQDHQTIKEYNAILNPPAPPEPPAPELPVKHSFLKRMFIILWH